MSTIPYGSSRRSGITLRLYDPETDQWSLDWASKRTGRLFPPVVGRFDADGTGIFHGDDEQTWITNWHMHMTRRAA